jgi:hypothetical protein
MTFNIQCQFRELCDNIDEPIVDKGELMRFKKIASLAIRNSVKFKDISLEDTSDSEDKNQHNFLSIIALQFCGEENIASFKVFIDSFDRNDAAYLAEILKSFLLDGCLDGGSNNSIDSYCKVIAEKICNSGIINAVIQDDDMEEYRLNAADDSEYFQLFRGALERIIQADQMINFQEVESNPLERPVGFQVVGFFDRGRR